MTDDFEDPRRVLARHGLSPKRSYSQNFLVSPRAVTAITKACQLQAGDAVVELGAGCGTLTMALARTGAKVFAVERDPDMLRVLAAEKGELDIELVAADAKQLDLGDFVREGGRISVAGNLPYAITGAIFRNLVEQHTRVARAVLMVQREVRDRLVAAPGTADYGALTVFTTQVFAVETVLHLPRTAFHPPPRVTSSVVRLSPAPRAERSLHFDRLVRAAFQARRKTLRNALAQALGVAITDAVLQAAGIDGIRRGETLSVEEYASLATHLAALGASPTHGSS
ncbi:MAG TPA: 16S rRNA (adenine(1518)-N(6)/adenine(1519)-N(6))-dimethyltransferase RsmA [Polyangiales bacterium]